MTLNESLKHLDYYSILNHVVKEKENKDKLKQLRILYTTYERTYPKSVINAAVLYCLRLKKKIPSNSYIEATLKNWFKNCKDEDDAALVLKERIQFEIDRRDMNAETKKAYQNKISMTKAAANYIGPDPARRIKQLVNLNNISIDEKGRN